MDTVYVPFTSGHHFLFTIKSKTSISLQATCSQLNIRNHIDKAYNLLLRIDRLFYPT